ncbi:MAG TPA: redoxin domain-containing protein [Candidatus Tumulicola sp.]|nr:redoxin domain-containing protein [Candidatus Tumulicola sp.]
MRIATSLLTLMLAAGCLAFGQAARAASAPSVGTKAPDFSLPTTGQNTMALSSLRGNVVVVNFFATWCPPCRAETPDLINVQKRFASRGVTFVGVDDREPSALVSTWAAANRVTFPLVLDADGGVEKTYDVNGIPTTYVLDKDGRIVFSQVNQLSGSLLASALNDVLAGRLPRESKAAKRFEDIVASSTADVSASLARGQTAQAIAAGTAASKKLDDILNDVMATDIDYAWASHVRDRLGLALAKAYETRAAAQPKAKTTAHDLEQAALLRGQSALDDERFDSALKYYRAAVRLAPKDTDAYDGVASVAGRTGDHATVLSIDVTEAGFDPKNPESWLGVANGYLGLKRYEEALRASHTGLALAAVDYALHPDKKHNAYELGRMWLKLARLSIAAGDSSGATWMLADSAACAPATIVAQQADEQFAALSPSPIYVAVSGAAQVVGKSSKPALLWVNVRNAAQSERTVHLSALGVPKRWVLSFCYEKVCDPYKSTITLGPGANQRVELQVVPLSSTKGEWDMRLTPTGDDTMQLLVDAKTAKAQVTVSAT